MKVNFTKSDVLINIYVPIKPKVYIPVILKLDFLVQKSQIDSGRVGYF